MEETDAKRGRNHRTTRNKDQGRGSPTRVSDLAAVVEHLHATICKGMEDGRSREASWRRTSSTMRTTSSSAVAARAEEAMA